MAMPVLVSLDNKQSQSMRMRMRMRKTLRVDALLLLGVLSLVLCLLVSICSAELQRFEHPPSKGDGSMGVVGEKLGIDFVVSTGDNFYDNGMTGENDAAFEESFTGLHCKQPPKAVVKRQVSSNINTPYLDISKK
ncbi:hypothetical protein HYC85_030445 [Camellia sinensis]|uniref:Calcineurin-like phosphoesterase domain-containing protein n=1 Tax=Camellia sinensis TaxID=4442 RepID=A0A7J7G4M2_CAMSI|nr:hypothetical protein HYC85_030445 [Camellia sinensis]